MSLEEVVMNGARGIIARQDPPRPSPRPSLTTSGSTSASVTGSQGATQSSASATRTRTNFFGDTTSTPSDGKSSPAASLYLFVFLATLLLLLGLSMGILLRSFMLRRRFRRRVEEALAAGVFLGPRLEPGGPNFGMGRWKRPVIHDVTLVPSWVDEKSGAMSSHQDKEDWNTIQPISATILSSTSPLDDSSSKAGSTSVAPPSISSPSGGLLRRFGIGSRREREPVQTVRERRERELNNNTTSTTTPPLDPRVQAEVERVRRQEQLLADAGFAPLFPWHRREWRHARGEVSAGSSNVHLAPSSSSQQQRPVQSSTTSFGGLWRPQLDQNDVGHIHMTALEETRRGRRRRERTPEEVQVSGTSTPAVVGEEEQGELRDVSVRVAVVVRMPSERRAGPSADEGLGADGEVMVGVWDGGMNGWRR